MRKRFSKLYMCLTVIVLACVFSGCVREAEEPVLSATIIIKRQDMGEKVCSVDYDIVNDNNVAVRNCVTVLPNCGNMQLNSFGIIDANKILDFETTFPCDGETCNLDGTYAKCERYSTGN